MTAPRRREPIPQRQLRVGVGSHVEHGEIIVRERPGEATECQRDEYELPSGSPPRKLHPRWFAAKRAGKRQHRLHEGDAQRDDESELSELGNHWLRAVRREARGAKAVSRRLKVYRGCI